jgi:phage/plasmid-associated DNA primase
MALNLMKKTAPHNTSFKAFDAKLTNNLNLKTNATYRELTAFVSGYKSAKTEDTNIIDQGQKISYNIPEKLLPQFFDLLEKCRRDGLTLNYSEKQLEPSGIMLDFDIMQDEEKSQLEDSHFYTMARHVIEMLSGMFVFTDSDRFSTYIMILRKVKTEYKESSAENEKGYFKDGFHMLIPGVKVSKNVKKYLIKRLLEEDVMKNVFDEVTFRNPLNDVLDKNSAHVVTLFPGNSKSGSKAPNVIHRIYKVEVKKNKVANLAQVNDFDKVNMVYEFSMNYENDKDTFIKKVEYVIRDDVMAQITQWACKPRQMNTETKNDLSILHMHDPDSDQLTKIIDILSPNRCIEYKYWFSIVCALAYTNDRYKPLAYHFSGARPKGVRVEFEKVWVEAITNKNKYSYSKEMIFNYAKIDNPEQYKIIVNESVFTKLTEAIFDQKIGGYVDHWHIAQLLKEMLGNKFIVDVDDSGSPRWYEFVLEDDPHVHGEIYKWRGCSDPYMLRNYLSMKVPIIFDRALNYLTDRKNTAAEEGQIKYYNELIKVVIQSSRKLFNHGHKNGIIQEAQSVFRKMNFSRSLDTEENIMGVGNGVLVMGKAPTLISSYHHYKISRFTPVNYKKMDPNNPVVLDVWTSIWDLFPDGEKDAFHKIMFFLSTSLTGRLKSSVMVQLRGGGANGKTYLMELMRNLLGAVNDGGYGTKLPIQYLIEREQMTHNASPVLVPLKYARLTSFSEADKSEHMRPAKLKKLASHEPINIRQLYGVQENIMHKSNFWIGTNYSLGINTTDHGTWRRIWQYIMKIKLCSHPDPENKYEKKADISFTTTKNRDPEFLSGMLSILTMYFGILEMKHGGDINDVESPTITRETEIFRNSQDTINRFITERVVITADENFEMPFTDLMDTYTSWFDNTVKEQRHDRLDIALSFESSRIANSIVKKAHGAKTVSGHRVLGAGEEKTDDERFLVVVEVEEEPEIPDVPEVHISAADSLTGMYDEYMKLLQEHDIKYW